MAVGGLDMIAMIAEFVLVCLSLTLYAVQALIRFWHWSLNEDQQQCQRMPWMSQIVRLFTGAFELGDHDGLNIYALRKLSQRVCARARDWSRVSGMVQCISAMFTIYHIVSSKGNKWTSPGQDFIQISFFALTLFVTVAPWTITISTLNIWYAVASVLVSLFCSLANLDMFLTVAYLVFLARVLLGVMSPRLGVVIAMNIVHAALVCQTYSRLSAPAQSCARLGVTTFAMIEIAMGIFVVFIVHVWRKSSYVEIRREAEANSIQRETSATQRLLGLMCDVVLVLDEELCFVENVPKFAAMFLFGANQSVKGAKFSDYMPIEYDRECLKHLTDEASACEDDGGGAHSGSMPGAMHATMRASEDVKVSVEIFYVKYREFGGALRYLVGVHEVADQPIPDLVQFPNTQRSTKRKAAATASAGTPPTKSASALDSTSGSQGTEAPLSAQPPRAATQPEQAAADAGGLGDQARPQLDEQAPLSAQPQRAATQPEQAPSSVRRSRSSGSGVSSRRSSRSPSVGSSTGVDIRGPSGTTAGAHFLLTTKRAQELTTIASMVTWNVPLPASACCSFHASLNEYQKTLARLKNSRCVSNFMPDWAAQCQECGVMCGWDLEKGSGGEALRCGCCRCQAVRKTRRRTSL